MPAEELAQIDAMVGAYERPAFIREAIRRELKRRQRGGKDSAGQSEG